MPPHNKGFDLRAVKHGRTLLVEVKGHRGASNIAEVTDAQLQEHARCLKSGDDETWQLWNIERLAASDPNAVSVTIVRRIPPEACRADRYRVDLRECEREPA
jgi:hypothetical protein